MKKLLSIVFVGFMLFSCTSKWDYRNKKADEIKEKKDKLCFDFFKEL